MSIFMLKNKRKRLKKWLPLYLMAMPGLIYLVINNYIPMAGIVVAFKQYNVRNGIFGSKRVDLKNFEFMFRSSDSWEAIRNTVLYNAAFIVVNLCVAAESSSQFPQEGTFAVSCSLPPSFDHEPNLIIKETQQKSRPPERI